MRYPVTLFPTLIVCIGQFGARVGLRLKAILAQRPDAVQSLFPMVVIADLPLQELNRYTVPDYIPFPRWREEEYIAWEPAPEARSRKWVAQEFSSRTEALQERIEEKYRAMRDPNLHLQIGMQGFAVGTQVGMVQTRLVVIASLTEALGAGIAFSVGQMLQKIVQQQGPPGSPVIAFLNLASWEIEQHIAPAGTVYAALQELHNLMDSNQPLFARCYLMEAERENGTRVSRMEDEAEMVASFLGLLLISDLYHSEGLHNVVVNPPARMPHEAERRPTAYAFNAFCTAALVLPRQLLRIVMALRLGEEMFRIWLAQPEPDPHATDQWQQHFLSSRKFTVGDVKNRFLERLNEIPETDYLPHIVWERVPREKWSDAIASADSFCGRYRIPVVIEQLEYIKSEVLLPQFGASLRESVDSCVYDSLQGVKFARKALEELRKAIDAIVQQLEEVVTLSTSDLSSYRRELDIAVANAPAWFTPFLYLLLPTALLTACTISADWGTPIEATIAAVAWAGWLGVGSFTNWLHVTKIQRLRDEYWDAVRQKWLNYLRSMCDQLTLEFFREASSIVQQEISQMDALVDAIRTVQELFESAQTEVLEEDFISKMNLLTPEQMQRFYESHRPDASEQALQFIGNDLRTIGWRKSEPYRLGETLFTHTFALWNIFDAMSIEKTIATNVAAAEERLKRLRERLSVLLRLSRVWVEGDEQNRASVEVHERFLFALEDKKNTVLVDYINQPALQHVDVLSTTDPERVTWGLLWANFPLEILGLLPILQEEWERLPEQERLALYTVGEKKPTTSTIEPAADEGTD